MKNQITQNKIEQYRAYIIELKQIVDDKKTASMADLLTAHGVPSEINRALENLGYITCKLKRYKIKAIT